MDSVSQGQRSSINSSGNVVDTNDEMWYTYGTKYDSGIENTPSDSGRVRKAVVNRIRSTDFHAGWTQTKGNSADALSLDDTTLCMSIRGAKVVKGGEGESVFTTTAALFEPVPHTFSAYIKTTGLTVSSGKKGAFIRVTDLMHCNGKNGTGAHYSMEIAGINFSFGDDSSITIKHGDDLINADDVWHGEDSDTSIPYVLVLTGVPYEDAVKGIAYFVGLALGDIAAKEVRSSNDVYSLMSEKKWIGHSHNSFKKYDFVNFPCIGPIVEALEEMGIQLIWGNCFEADNVGDKKFGYKQLKDMPESNFRFAYVFRNKYLNQRITYMRRNADGVFAPY